MVKSIPLESGDIVIVNWNTIGHLAGWIESLFAISKKLPDCGILTALVLDSNDKIYVHGGLISPRFNVPTSRAMGEAFYNQYPGTQEVEVSHLICAIVKKALIKKLPLPERVSDSPFIDGDYCLQARKLGFKIYATSDVIVQYSGAAITGMTERDYARQFDDDYQIFNKKWGPEYAHKLKTPVMYQTSIAMPSGFAQAAREYIRALVDNGVDVSYNFLRGTNEEEGESEDEIVNSICENHGNLKIPQIIWAQAPYFNKNSGRYKIGHAEFEGDALPPDWAEYCNMMDEVWVPTNWDREKFRKGGVNKPLYVIPQGIRKEYFHPEIAPMRFELEEGFKFICNAAWDPRKNLQALIAAFQQEFTKGESVCLVIKTANLGLVQNVRDEVKRIKSNKDSAKVYIKEEIVKPEAVGCFYTAGDCFVFPTHGEAWGLPLFEALACGVPVITTDYGAPAETLRDGNKKPLPGVHFIRQQKTLTDTSYIYLQGNFWAEPSIPHLRELMRYVFDHKKEEKAAALKTSELIRKKYDWHEAVKPIQARLKEIYQSKL
jgi:glycosyltransferase involved in cell wall biosynthesis